jgi:Fe-S cluster assembly scaffold protein SufB
MYAGCEGIKTATYSTLAGQEMKYPMSDTREVHVDNEAEVKWITGNVSSKRSRHMDVKIYTGRHAHEEDPLPSRAIP